MQIQKETKLFAFKVAEQKEKDVIPAAQWQVRDGVAVAGCTDPTGGTYDVRYMTLSGADDGVYC